jgi:hypothetical protein
MGREPPNGLALSRAAPLDRANVRAAANFQNRRDILAASGVGYSAGLGGVCQQPLIYFIYFRQFF